MIRLLVNAGGRKAGSEVDPAELGAEFAQQLLDAGQAEPVAPTDAAEPVLLIVADVFHQAREISTRLRAVVADVEQWPEEDRVRVANALVDGIAGDWLVEIEGLADLLDLADRRPGRREADGDDDEAGGATDASAAAAQLAGASDAAQAGGNAAEATAAAAASTNTPPSEPGPSGDAAGAAVPVAEPSAPAKAAAPTSGRAPRRRSGG